LVAVVAKGAETFWIPVFPQPTVEIAIATQLLSLSIAASVDVINAEELVSRLSATGACYAIVFQNRGFQPLVPITVDGITPTLIQTTIRY
jgi:hypothetical protein